MSETIKKLFSASKLKRQEQVTQHTDIAKLLTEVFRAVSKATTPNQIQEMTKLLDKVNHMLLLHQVATMKPAIGTLDKPETKEQHGKEPAVTTTELALRGLEDITTSKICPVLKKRLFLLHRPTQDFEYDKFAQSGDKAKEVGLPDSTSIAQDTQESFLEYSTDKPTEWVVDSVLATQLRNGDNPVVSVWVPEDKISDVSGSQENKGTWGELGNNKQKNLVTVTIKEGTYKIYSELKV